jgi:preprotein translocase subunit YajC
VQDFVTAAAAASDQAAGKSGGGAGSWLLPLLIVLVGVYFFTMQRRRQRTAQNEQSRLGPGTLVMTRGGLYGTIVEVDGDDVLLEIAPDVVCRFNRGAIGRVVSAPDALGVPEDDTAVSLEKDGEHEGGETPREPTAANAAEAAGGKAPGPSDDARPPADKLPVAEREAPTADSPPNKDQ